MIRPALALPLLLALCACVAGPPPKRKSASAPTAASTRPTPARNSVQPATLTALNNAQRQINLAQQKLGSFTDADSLMREARAASARAEDARAQSLANEANTRAKLALDGYYVTASAQELQKLYSVTGLNDEQLGRLREAEVALVRGEGARAHGLLAALNKELSSEKKHQVKSGESLWSISARPEVYANGFLWPLIWEANKDTVPNPDQLAKGQTLRIRPNPTVDEVVRAVDYARNQAGRRVRIGTIEEEKP